MARLAPFVGWVVTPEAAERVVAPAYDALTAEEREAVADAEPDSFLHVLGTPHEEARRTLDRLLTGGAFARTPGPAYHLLRMRLGDHVQTGIVGTVPVGDLGDVVKLHEDTRVEKEHDLVRHLEVVGVASSPVGLVHPGPALLPELVAAVTAAEPTVHVASEDGLVQEVWTVSDGDAIEALRAAIDLIPSLYLTDGHHRSAATARFAAGDPEVPLLAVVFPASELDVHPYHRVVHDLGGEQRIRLVEQLAPHVPLRPVTGDPVPPSRAGEALLHVDRRWYALDLAGDGRPVDPVAALDVSVLQTRVLAPVLGITDARTDPRLEFVPGVEGLDGLVRRAGDHGVAFALAPTSIGELMAIADAGAVMPPKSTWFEPKVRSGLFVLEVAGWQGPEAVR